MTVLRDYQTRAVGDVRNAMFRERKQAVLLQFPTGAGKTRILAAIFDGLLRNGWTGIFVVPRRELVKQASAELSGHGITHGIIDARHKESRAYKLHVGSLQTVRTRTGKIKTVFNFVCFDECHTNTRGQKKIISALKAANPEIKILGLTATPDRGTNKDGPALKDIYESIIYGASIPYLTQCGFLSPLRYYAPPTDGIRALKFKSTGEPDQDELDKLLSERAVYGRAVDYYTKLARLPDGSFRRGVGFCAGIKAAEKQAAEFRARGFRAEHIDGKMPDKKQRLLLDGLAEGRIQVLCSADLLLYGWDSPKVSYGFLLRRTKSKALYFQIVGRILRVAEGKPDAIFVDHTATVDLHTDRSYPGVPPFYLDHVQWGFNGEGKQKKDAAPPPEVRLCPYDSYLVCVKKIRCPQCDKYVPAGEGEEQIIESIPLQERTIAGEPQIITPAEKREIQDGVGVYVEAARTAEDDEAYELAVRGLCTIAEKLQYRPLWVYWRLSEQKFTVNVRALHAIAKAKGYKPYWAKKEAERLREQMGEDGDFELSRVS